MRRRRSRPSRRRPRRRSSGRSRASAATSAVMWRVASTPLIVGMFRSMTTTSGASSRTSLPPRRRSRPRRAPARPCSSSRLRRPVRKRSWSSTSRTRTSSWASRPTRRSCAPLRRTRNVEALVIFAAATDWRARYSRIRVRVLGRGSRGTGCSPVKQRSERQWKVIVTVLLKSPACSQLAIQTSMRLPGDRAAGVGGDPFAVAGDRHPRARAG